MSIPIPEITPFLSTSLKPVDCISVCFMVAMLSSIPDEALVSFKEAPPGPIDPPMSYPFPPVMRANRVYLAKPMLPIVRALPPFVSPVTLLAPPWCECIDFCIKLLFSCMRLLDCDTLLPSAPAIP